VNLNTAARPSFYVIVGAPGAGKSSQIIFERAERRAAREVIFDIEGEAAGRIVRSCAEVKVALIAAGKGPCQIVYRPGTDDPVLLRARFGVCCQLVFAAGNILYIVDEVADVDSPNPHEVVPAWAKLLRRGRKRDLAVIAGTQRPADVNKKLWSFATRLRVGRLLYGEDRRLLASALNVDVSEVAALIDTQWIERSVLTGETTRGVMRWQRGRPVNVPRAGGSPDEPVEKKVGRPRRSQ
jgi:hypothetical protein